MNLTLSIGQHSMAPNMPELRQVSGEHCESSFVLRVIGPLDHAAARELVEKIQAEFSGGRRGRIVIELSQVTFVRSSGIGGVVQISFDHDLRVAGASVLKRVGKD